MCPLTMTEQCSFPERMSFKICVPSYCQISFRRRRQVALLFFMVTALPPAIEVAMEGNFLSSPAFPHTQNCDKGSKLSVKSIVQRGFLMEWGFPPQTIYVQRFTIVCWLMRVLFYVCLPSPLCIMTLSVNIAMQLCF